MRLCHASLGHVDCHNLEVYILKTTHNTRLAAMSNNM